MHSFSDADWAGCKDDRGATTGFCIFLGENHLSCFLGKVRKEAAPFFLQYLIRSKSSREAEYRAMAATAS